MKYHVFIKERTKLILDSTFDSPIGAYSKELELKDSHPSSKIFVVNSSDTKVFLKKHKGKKVFVNKYGIVIKNPRPSRYKNALKAEALKYNNFYGFADAYWTDCNKGIYWIPLKNKDLDFESLLKERKNIPALCSPKHAEDISDYKFFAEVNTNRLPKKAINSSKGSPNKRISGEYWPQIEVMRILSKRAALKAWNWQSFVLPNSIDDLYIIWKKAHDDKERELGAASKAAQRARERERRARERAEVSAETDRLLRVAKGEGKARGRGKG